MSLMVTVTGGIKRQGDKWLQMASAIHDYGDGGDDSNQDNLKFDLMINEIFRNCVRLFKFLFVHIPYM